MMDRKATIITLGLAMLILAKVLLNMVMNPLDGIRDELTIALAEVPSKAPLSDDGIQDFARLAQEIRAVPSLWKEIVPPPPAAVPRAPKLPTAPNLADMLENVSIGKGQIGTTKIKVFTPQSPRGRWLEVGGEINGCVLESFTREEAIFSHNWEKGGQILEVSLYRE